MLCTGAIRSNMSSASELRALTCYWRSRAHHCQRGKASNKPSLNWLKAPCLEILHVVRRCKILQLLRHCKTKNQCLKIMCGVVRFCWCWGGCSSWPASWRGSLNIWLHVTWDERHRKTIFGPVNFSSGSQSSDEFQMFQVELIWNLKANRCASQVCVCEREMA